MSRNILMRVHDPGEYLDNFGVAVLEVTPEMAEVFLNRYEDFKYASARDSALYSLEYHDWSLQGWYAAPVTCDPALDELLDCGVLEVPEIPPLSNPCVVEAPTMLVTEEGFYWECMIKHAPMGRLTTEIVGWRHLDDVHEDRPVRPGGVSETAEGAHRTAT